MTVNGCEVRRGSDVTVGGCIYEGSRYWQVWKNGRQLCGEMARRRDAVAWAESYDGRYDNA
jgi:hypothetical protein